MRTEHLMKRRSEAGISMLEVIVATVILTVGLVPIIAMMRNALHGGVLREGEIRAVLSGQNLLEDIRRHKWDENTPGVSGYSATRSTLGADGESPSSNFDDIDDFEGYSDAPDGSLTRVVQVHYVTMDPGAEVAESGVATDFKRVRVTVTSTKNLHKPAVLTAVLVNGN